MTESAIVSSPQDRSPRPALDRPRLVERYRRVRARSEALFGLVSDEAFYARPIALRLPVVFYAGHLPIFSFNTLVRKGLGGPSLDPRMEVLFARGIDPHEALAADGLKQEPSWPSRDEVRALSDEADRRVIEALGNAPIEQPGHPLLDRAEAVFCILEHEAMHQETLLYMWHQLPHGMKRRPEGYRPRVHGASPAPCWVDVPGGRVALGVDPETVDFTWDNERPACSVEVADFRMERHNVTNDRFLEFVESGGYADERWWRPADWVWVNAEKIQHPPFWIRRDGAWWWNGMFDLIALPPSWPVYVTHAEASAFARWQGHRLPTEAEYQRAAFGSPGGEPRLYPWGDQEPDSDHGVFDFASWDPEPVGCHRYGTSAWGIEDLMGNGWEWTSTEFAPFPGFKPLPSYPEYSADFFDGEHFVMKGASPATARELLRPSFRNWFRPRYPFVYATFRCVDHSPERRTP